MNEAPVVVRQIIWRDVFPWLLLLRVFRVAISPGPLFLATLAVILCSLSWWTCGFLLLSKEEFALEKRPVLLSLPYQIRKLTVVVPDSVESVAARSNWAAIPYWDLTEPVRRLFDSRTSFRHVVYYFVGSLIAIVIWSFVGGVISRQTLVELGAEQTYDWFDGIGFVIRRYPQYLMAPLAPLIALVVMGLLLVPLGWLMRLDFGLFVAGLLWIFVIVFGLVAAWLMIGVLFGWPLMFGVIGSKRDSDSLQAFSDSFSYVYGKPLHYLFYALVALFLGGLALYLIDLIATAATEFGFWATSWGAGETRMEQIRAQLAILASGREIRMLNAEGQEVEVPMMQRGGVWLISLALTLVEVVKVAAAYSYFFASSTVIFLLMRLAVDEKEMDEIHMEDEEEHIETARRAMLDDAPPPVVVPQTDPFTAPPPIPPAEPEVAVIPPAKELPTEEAVGSSEGEAGTSLSPSPQPSPRSTEERE
jgi:hypothetical protein